MINEACDVRRATIGVLNPAVDPRCMDRLSFGAHLDFIGGNAHRDAEPRALEDQHVVGLTWRSRRRAGCTPIAFLFQETAQASSFNVKEFQQLAGVECSRGFVFS
jgi:hypothetical protein